MAGDVDFRMITLFPIGDDLCLRTVVIGNRIQTDFEVA